MVCVIQFTVTACEQDQDGTAVPQAVSKPVCHIATESNQFRLDSVRKLSANLYDNTIAVYTVRNS